MNGVSCLALVDTGCTRSIVHVARCSRWTAQRINVITVSGGRYECLGTGPVRVGVCSGVSADVDALVVADRPLGFSLVLGMDAVVALGGVTVKSADKSVFGCELTAVAGGAAGGLATPVNVAGGAAGGPVAASARECGGRACGRPAGSARECGGRACGCPAGSGRECARWRGGRACGRPAGRVGNSSGGCCGRRHRWDAVA